jgi:Disulphide bond corrector protein DsbC
MLHLRRITSLAAALVALASTQVHAEEKVDPSTLYEVSTDGTSTKVKAGEQGVFVLSIKSKPGAHVSDEAPLKLELKGGAQLAPAQEKLALKDSVAKKAAGQQFVDPRFEVPFKATAAGKGTLEAKLTFFICSEQLCARQQKTFSLPVEVL